jgi:tyrosine-protein phosphatase SIW14
MASHRQIWMLGALLAVSSLACLSGCGDGRASLATSHPATMPYPIGEAPVHLQGVPAFAKVSEELYRGGQPSAEGFAELKSIGIKTVVSLRVLGSDRRELSGTGLRYFQLHVNPLHPEEEDVLAFLKVVSDPRNRPVFVHCRQGRDRTGMMVAVYRMVVQNWTKQDALAEMKARGFRSGWEEIEEYVTRLDVQGTRKKLASAKAPRVAAIP